jgi:hypothetical protein
MLFRLPSSIFELFDSSVRGALTAWRARRVLLRLEKAWLGSAKARDGAFLCFWRCRFFYHGSASLHRGGLLFKPVRWLALIFSPGVADMRSGLTTFGFTIPERDMTTLTLRF